MSNHENGWPAFPLKEPLTSDSEGMSLRDYFAAKALVTVFFPGGPTGQWPTTQEIEPCAIRCYEIADAMLKARQA